MIRDLAVLEETLTTLVKSAKDVALFGNKSSGKTTMATQVLNKVLGEGYYVSIKSIFVGQKSQFLYLLGDQLVRIFKILDSDLFKNVELPKFAQADLSQTMQGWIKRFSKYLRENKQITQKLKSRIYVFIDNIEDLTISESFIKEVYRGLKAEVKSIKFSFFFCGLFPKTHNFMINEPFKSIPIFVMPRPDITIVINKAINEYEMMKVQIKQKQISQKEERIKQKIPQHQKKILKHQIAESKQFIKSIAKLSVHMKSFVFSSFESVEYQLTNVNILVKAYLQKVNQYIKDNHQTCDSWRHKNNFDNQSKILDNLKVYGPVLSLSEEQQKYFLLQNDFYRENYPSLIMASLGLANGFAESDDMKRFIDLRKIKGNRTDKKNEGKETFRQYKQDHRPQRHYQQRIIAISQVIQQQSEKGFFKFGESQLISHSLDFYGCIQYLRDQGSLHFYGKSSSSFGGKVYGETKQAEIKMFMKRADIQYYQFTGRD